MDFYNPKHKKEKNSALKKAALPLMTSVIFMATVLYWNNKNYGLALEYNGQEIAKVQSGEVYEKANSLIRNQVEPTKKQKINKVKPQIKITPVTCEECCEKPEEIKDKIIENSGEELTRAFAIYVNNKIVAVAKTEDELKTALEEITKESTPAQENCKTEIEEKIEIKEGLFENSKIEEIEKVKEKLRSQTQKIETYTVTEEDSVVSIAEKFGISPEKLLSDNGKTPEDQIFPGDKLQIILPDTLIHIKTTSNEFEEKEIPFEIISEEDANLEKGKTITTQEGSNGKEITEYKVIYLNGKKVKKEKIEAKVTICPKAEKKKIGTKKCKEYVWPVPFTKNITSGFGPRWGTFHSGIDISSPGVEGTDIVAAKDGVVEKASEGNKGYGNYIIIKHNDGTETLYGHCQKLCVKQGKAVSQGDKIALVGSTGDSTGAHLHLEVIINGKKMNPTDYFS